MGQILDKIITSSDDNLETFSLLWLDISVNSSENRATQDELRRTINQVKTFDNPNQCEQYIYSVSKEDRIVLIVSGQLGREIVPRIHALEQLLSIYVYCKNQRANEEWSVKCPKVKAVVTDFKELISRIQFDHEKQQKGRIYESLSISIFDPKVIHDKLTTDLQGNLVHSQLLINCLLRMKSKMEDRNELITLSKQIYKMNKTELKTITEFEKNYKRHEAIRWYTRDTFISRLLNKALRTQNIDILFLFQFFIADIREQLANIGQDSPVRVYRSQFMSGDELKKLKSSKGQFISINSFISATKHAHEARKNFEKTDGLEQVIFQIDADPQLNKDKPFANIKDYTYNNAEEVLFMLGSIFQIVNVYRETDGIWIVELKLCSDSSEQFDSIKDVNNLLSFGRVLITMGKIEEAEIYYRRLIDQLEPGRQSDLARCYEALGSVADEKHEYDASLQLYNNALNINMKRLEKQHPDIASNYNCIGDVYRKRGDFKKAFEYYEKALETLGNNPTIEGLGKQALCYNNMGIAYQDRGEYKEALDFYRKALEIREKNFPSDETSIGMSYNNIGNAFYSMKYYKDALYYYDEALKRYRKYLPPQHPKFASTYNNLGAICDEKNEVDKALEYYKDALKIYRNIYPPTHPNVMKIQENIDRITLKQKK